jgi:hypothetical protein
LAASAGGDAIVKDGVEVTILPAVAAFSGREGFVEVMLDVEAHTEDAAHRLGVRSVRAVADVDCRQGANRFVSARAYDQPELSGAGRAWPVGGDWVQPAADSYMSAVLSRVCGHAPTAPGPVTRVTAESSAAAVPSAPPPASIASPKPAARPVPPGALRAALPPPAPLASGGAAPAQTVRPTAPAVAQVAASPTAKGAQRELDALHSLIGPPLAGTVEPATVGGVQVFRASVTGFASAADARGFCAKAAALVKACWVRPNVPPPARAVAHRT